MIRLLTAKLSLFEHTSQNMATETLSLQSIKHTDSVISEAQNAITNISQGLPRLYTLETYPKPDEEPYAIREVKEILRTEFRQLLIKAKASGFLLNEDVATPDADFSDRETSNILKCLKLRIDLRQSTTQE